MGQTPTGRASAVSVVLLLLLGAPITLFIAFLIRFDFQILVDGRLSWVVLYFARAVPLTLGAKLPGGIVAAVVNRSVRAPGVGISILLSALAAWLGKVLFSLAVYANYAVFRGQGELAISPGFPRSVYLLDAALTLVWTLIVLLALNLKASRSARAA